ncbi:PAS domain-containing protein, partial [Acinetobacter baumannii]
MNQLWLDITGARLEDVYGDGWLDFLHPDDREPARAAWRNCVERDIPYDIEYRLSSGGGYRW